MKILITDISEHVLLEIKNFFQNYKTLQNIKVDVYSYYDKKEALKIINDSFDKYKKSQN